MKITASILIGAGILCLSAFKYQAETEKSLPHSIPAVQNFRAHLSGDSEVPVKETSGVGEAIFQLNNDGTELSYKLIVANIENVTAAHIHAAPVGVNGPIVVPLYTSGLLPGRTNGILAQGVIVESDLTGPLTGLKISDLIDLINNGGAYVNVHTSNNPAGEIRGQVF